MEQNNSGCGCLSFVGLGIIATILGFGFSSGLALIPFAIMVLMVGIPLFLLVYNNPPDSF